MAVDGTDVRPLVSGVSLDPDYTSDGASVAYVAPDGDRNLEIYRMSLATGEAVQLSFSPFEFDYRLPKGDPDAGGFVATYRNRQSGAEEVRRISGGAVQTIAAGSGAVVQPRPEQRGRSFTGTSRGDLIRGTPGADVIDGRAGDDRLFGRGGDDRVSGGAGRDLVDGGGGRDRLLGGSGGDRLQTRDRTRDIVSCGPGRDRVVADRIDVIAGDCESVRPR